MRITRSDRLFIALCIVAVVLVFWMHMTGTGQKQRALHDHIATECQATMAVARTELDTVTLASGLRQRYQQFISDSDSLWRLCDPFYQPLP